MKLENKLEKNPKVSIIVPNWNGLDDISSSLESIHKLDYPPKQLEIIVVDNHSTDGSVEFIKGRFPNVKLHQFQKNFGYTKALNYGAKLAKNPFLLFLDNDVVLAKNCLKRLIQTAIGKEKLIVGPKVYFKNQPKIVESGNYKFNFWLAIQKRTSMPKKLSECEFILGCIFLVPKKAFGEVGMFDEKYFFHFADQDFMQRTKKSGYKLIYQPQAIAWHGKAKKTASLSKKTRYLEWNKGKFRMVFKYASPLQIITVVFANLTFVPILHFLQFKSENYPTRIQAILWNLKR